MARVPKHRRILGENIRSVRTAEGLTENQLAQLAEVDASDLRAIERGTRDASFDTIVRIANALQISVHDLTGGL